MLMHPRQVAHTHGDSIAGNLFVIYGCWPPCDLHRRVLLARLAALAGCSGAALALAPDDCENSLGGTAFESS
jgi:hypothetical protein